MLASAMPITSFGPPWLAMPSISISQMRKTEGHEGEVSKTPGLNRKPTPAYFQGRPWGRPKAEGLLRPRGRLRLSARSRESVSGPEPERDGEFRWSPNTKFNM